MFQADLSQWTVAPALDWRIEFGLWLRNTPTAKRRERGQLTLEAYERDIALMGKWLETLNNEAFQPGQMNAFDLKSYFGMVEKVSKPSTYNRKLASARMLINWSRSVGILDYDPAEWIPFANAVRNSPRDVTDAEYAKLEEAAVSEEASMIGLRDSIIFHLMGAVGLRISEAVELKECDLHLDEGYIHVLGKGKKHREPKIGNKLIEKILLWLDRKPVSVEGTLVTDENGLAIGRGQAWRRFCVIAEKAGVKTTPHAMRSTYVMRYMNAYMQGDPWQMPAALKAACQQTGDTPEVILKFYTGARESSMRAAAELM